MVVRYYDVAALQVPVCHWHLWDTAGRGVAVQVGQATGNRPRQRAQLRPGEHMTGQVVLQVAQGVVSHDEPVLPLGAAIATPTPLLCRQELHHVFVLEVGIGEDGALVAPGHVLHGREDLDGHRLVLALAVVEAGAPHLGEAALAHQGLQLNGQLLGVVVQAVGSRGRQVGRAVVHEQRELAGEVAAVDHHGAALGRIQRLVVGALGGPVFGLLAKMPGAVEVEGS